MAFRPRDLADRMAARQRPDDGYLRETFTLPRDKARATARDFLTRYPKAAYMSGVEHLARTARRGHRIYHAAAAQRRLMARLPGHPGASCQGEKIFVRRKGDPSKERYEFVLDYLDFKLKPMI